MSTITQITEHPRKPGRYVIDVDGREFAIVTADVLSETKTRIGVEIDDARAALLREASEITDASTNGTSIKTTCFMSTPLMRFHCEKTSVFSGASVVKRVQNHRDTENTEVPERLV